jgi:hypothetical protein
MLLSWAFARNGRQTRVRSVNTFPSRPRGKRLRSDKHMQHNGIRLYHSSQPSSRAA